MYKEQTMCFLLLSDFILTLKSVVINVGANVGKVRTRNDQHNNRMSCSVADVLLGTIKVKTSSVSEGNKSSYFHIALRIERC